jgi:L-arginine dehydrogenase
MSNAPLVLDAATVSQYLPHIDVLQEMRQLFVELGRAQAVQPAQTLTLFPDERGDFITYLGAAAGAGVFGAKLSPYLVQDGPPIITAWTVLMSMETGQPLMLCDAGQLTTERTAATTALAVDHLAKQDATTLAIIGTGAVAQAHWRQARALRQWEKVVVYSPRLSQSGDVQQIWRDLCPQVTFASSAEGAAADADVVMLCTSSGTPVVDAAVIGTGTLVTSISTNVARAHEIDPAFLSAADVYCDYRQTTPTTAGEMQIAAQEHGWSADRVQGDLPGLAIAQCPTPSGTRPIFFRSIGLGLEDIAVAHALFRAASA